MIRLHTFPARLAGAATILLFVAGMLMLGAPATAAQQLNRTSCSGCPQIKHVVIIVKENHSFDNIFGQYPGADGTSMAQEGKQTVLMGDTPDELPHDLPHSSSAALKGVNGGKMNRFYELSASSNDGDLSDSQYQSWQVPDYYQYASQFALADHFFSTVMGPSFPNHLVLIQGQTDHVIDNPHGPNGAPKWGCGAASNVTVNTYNNGTYKQVFPCFNSQTLADEANAAHLPWRYYAAPAGHAGFIWSTLGAIKHIYNSSQWTTNVLPSANFVSDVANGQLAPLTWVMPPFADSEHPPQSMCVGENWTVDQINAIAQSQFWQNTVIVLLWDDFGGFYDHVPPPQETKYALGPRVGMLLISPFSKPGFVDHSQYDSRSVLKFVENTFNLPHLASFDRKEKGISNMLNLTAGATPLPPPVLSTQSCSAGSSQIRPSTWRELRYLGD